MRTGNGGTHAREGVRDIGASCKGSIPSEDAFQEYAKKEDVSRVYIFKEYTRRGVNMRSTFRRRMHF